LSDTVIKVENLGKRYRLGQTAGYNTLRDTISSSYHRVFHRQPGQDQQEHEYIWALKDVSFEIKRGEAVGIIGRNGSGKSTLLKILSRIVTPTEGYAEIHGRTGSLLEVGTGFHPELSGRENIFLNGAVLGMKKTDINRKLEEIVTFSEIGDFLDTPVKRYSSGMYVRLAFAVAAHLEPDILLLDEVLAVGDAQFQKKCLGKMNDVTKEGRTVVFVSHNIVAVETLCTRVILLDKGIVATDNTPQKAIYQYLGITSQEHGEVIWSESSILGYTNVRLKRARIVSQGVTTHYPPIDKEVSIEFVYENLVDNANLDVSIHLRDKTGSFVLATANWPSANTDRDYWSGRPHPNGIYRSTCIIPANFLNDGYYAVDIGISSKGKGWEVWVPSAISFIIHDTGEMRKEYKGEWVGVVRPKMKWNTDLLS
jgi:lipopolysaccharide transport system ATP-binding protein